MVGFQSRRNRRIGDEELIYTRGSKGCAARRGSYARRRPGRGAGKKWAGPRARGQPGLCIPSGHVDGLRPGLASAGGEMEALPHRTAATGRGPEAESSSVFLSLAPFRSTRGTSGEKRRCERGFSGGSSANEKHRTERGRSRSRLSSSPSADGRWCVTTDHATTSRARIWTASAAVSAAIRLYRCLVLNCKAEQFA